MIGTRLKELRKKRGIKTQAELAELSGISHDTIKNLECERRMPSRDTLIKLAKFFDCEVEYLLGEERDGRVVSGDMAKLVEMLEGLPEEQRKIMFKLIQTMK